MALMFKDIEEKDYVQVPNTTARAVEEKNNDNPISLEALGLITNIWSYDIQKWEVHKTELYKRYGKNKKTSVSNAWDELVAADYIIEFKYRKGRKWEYVYIYRIRPYSKQEKEERLAKAVELSGVSSTSDFQKLKMGSSKCTVQNTHIRNTVSTQNKRKKDKLKKDLSSLPETATKSNIDNIIDDDEKEPFEINFYAFKEFKKEFQDNFPNYFDEDFYSRIIESMTEKQIDFITYAEAVEQLRYMTEQREKGLIIADSAKYFVGGIELRRTSRHSALNKEKVRKAEKELKQRKEKQEQNNKYDRVPFYNWLEN